MKSIRQARTLRGSRSLILILLLVASSAAQPPAILLEGQTFRVSGWTGASGFPEARLAEIFSVSVDAADVPALSGQYRIENGDLVFSARYPLGPGMRYRAELRIPSEAPITRVFETPPADDTPTTFVERVYPSGSVLPENQLKFYIHFSAPMSRGEAYDRIHLLDAAENTVEDAFLELPEELWDPDARRLTIFFDPGRIKTGLVPNVEMGTALEAGKAYTLVIDREWRDGENKRLKERFTKPFSVGPADKSALNVAEWRITSPGGSTRNPLTVEFPESLDHALIESQIEVIDAAGAVVPGSIEISANETRWQFRPSSPWQPGQYALRIGAVTADLAGNMLGRLFEVDVFDRVEQNRVRETQNLPFSIN
jgi:hypothetical protein